MSDDVTVRLALRDELSRPLDKVDAKAKATTASLRAMGGAETNSALNKLTVGVGDLGGSLSNLDSRLNRVSRTLTTDIVRNAERLGKAFIVSAGAVDYFGLKAVDSFQRSQAAFATLTGSVEAGRDLYAQLMAFNLQSPFDMPDLTRATQTLLGFGYTAKNVIPTLQALANVAALQQNPAEALSSMALAIGQINQAGVVRAQDLNQLVQAGFPAYKLLASIVGSSGGDLRKQMQAGLDLPSSQFLDALNTSSVLQPYAGAAKAMNDTLSGQLSNAKTILRQGLIDAFTPVGNELKGQIPGFTEDLQGFVEGTAPGLSRLLMDVLQLADKVLPILEPLVNAGLTGAHMLLSALEPALVRLAPVAPDLADAMTQLFAAFSTPEVIDALVTLVSLLPDLLRLFTELVTPLVQITATLLSFKPLAEGLLIALIGYRLLSPIIGVLSGMATAMWDLAAATEAEALAGSGVGGKLGKGAKGKLSGKVGGVLGLVGLAGFADLGWNLGNDLFDATGLEDGWLTKKVKGMSPWTSGGNAVNVPAPVSSTSTSQTLIRVDNLHLPGVRDPETFADALDDYATERTERR